MIVIGLSGKARSGKGSVVQLASILLQKGDDESEVRQVSFATSLKLIAKSRGWDGQKNDAGRTFLQNLGMEMREIDSLFWVKQAVAKVEAIRVVNLDTKIVFIPDCRYLNEVEYLKNNLGAEIWRVERFVEREENPGRRSYDNGLTPEQKAHPSETELDKYPYFDVYLRAGDLGELFDQVMEQLDRLQREGKI